jgi:hypothetical protein
MIWAVRHLAALAPVTFDEDPSAVMMLPAMCDPVRVPVWRALPTSRHPHISAPFPAMVTPTRKRTREPAAPADVPRGRAAAVSSSLHPREPPTPIRMRTKHQATIYATCLVHPHKGQGALSCCIRVLWYVTSGKNCSATYASSDVTGGSRHLLTRIPSLAGPTELDVLRKNGSPF